MSLLVVMDADGSSLQIDEFTLPDPKITRFTVMNLTPQRQYYFYLQALTAVGPGEAIKVKGATLLDGGEIAFHLSALFHSFHVIIRRNVTEH